jgi:acyl-CoA thioesterase-1
VSNAFLIKVTALRNAAAHIQQNWQRGRHAWLALCLALAAFMPAVNAGPATTHAATLTATAATAATPAAQAILVLGDSLSAAYGIPRESGWVGLLEQKLAQRELTNGNVARTSVINASISGETTEGGLARLPALLQKYKPSLVVIELGANDGLRGFQIDRLRANLEQLIRLSQASGAKVLLVGIKIPPNYGLRYTSDFYESYTLLAHEYNIPLVPFLLEGVATDPELMQDDRLHPRAGAQPKILNNMWPYLQKML